MVPFQVDPSWYERYWWREPRCRQRRSSAARVFAALARIGRALSPAVRFLGIVLILLVSGDFRLPGLDHALDPADQRIKPDGEHHQHDAAQTIRPSGPPMMFP